MNSLNGQHLSDADWIAAIREIEGDLDGPETLRELEPVKVGSLQMRDFKEHARDERRGMELTAMMAVFLVGMAIGICGTVMVLW